MTYIRHYRRRDRRLGRVVVHDPASRGFALATPVDTSTWHTKLIRVWDPLPNPNQCHGECTFVAKCTQFNAVGNRVTGVTLKMDTAHRGYGLATLLDPFVGQWAAPTWEDTGSSGLAAAKAAQQLGLGGEYRWIFNGADGVVQAVMDGWVVNVGTRWDERMFDQDSRGFITPGGAVSGGHEWSVRGYDEPTDAVVGRCWWGQFRDFYIKREHLAELLADDGDALVQKRVA